MKTVKISELKANLAKYLRIVKAGEDVDILDRDIWVARLVGASSSETKLRIQPPTKDPTGLGKLKSKQKKAVDIEAMDILNEERQRR